MPLFDRKDKSRYATFTRRTLMMGGGIAAVMTALGARLYQLQILEGEEFMTRADENRVNQRLLAPLRGRILDRFGAELATNRRNYRVDLIPEQALEGVDAALDTIGRIIVISPRDRERILHDVAENKQFVPTTIAENLTWDEFARVNLHLPYLPGIQPEVGETRNYPFGDQLSHVLGYVAAVSPDDKTNDDDPLLDLPGFRIGKRGIEKAFDLQVRGTAGASRVEVNAYGRVIRELGRDPGVPGSDVYLTIDNEVQKFVAQRLGNESAACVVMDVANGDVIAMASTPGYDPNEFNVGITETQWKGLNEDDHHPLINKVLSGVYPPGSTFKPAVALSALDSGCCPPDFSVNCTGSLQFGNYVFHCWKKGGHGHVDLHRGIAASCDVFFYEVAKRIGIDAIEDGAHKLGLGYPDAYRNSRRKGGRHSRAARGRKRPIMRPGSKAKRSTRASVKAMCWSRRIQLCMLAARIASGNAVVPRIVRVVGHNVRSSGRNSSVCNFPMRRSPPCSPA